MARNRFDDSLGLPRGGFRAPPRCRRSAQPGHATRNAVASLGLAWALLLVPGAATAADAPAGTATLRVETTAACMLKLADREPQELAAGLARELSVPPGEVTLECTSTTTPAARAVATRPLKIGAIEAVQLDGATLVVEQSRAGKPATFADLGGGILRHCVTRADWTDSDGASDVDFAAARELCEKRGARWTLPKADELYALVDRSGRASTTCGRFTCNVSPRFKLTAPTFWAADRSGAELGMIVNLMLGGRHAALDRMKAGYRALCVRPPAS
jgi:hypothetical protein